MKAFALSAVAVSAVLVFAISFPPLRGSAAPKAAVTPTPAALQYDEISRMIADPATPPPPGSFSADYQLAMTPPSAAPTAAPQAKHHGIGGLLAGALSGNPVEAAAGAVAENAEDNMASSMIGSAMGNMMQMMSLLRNGHVVRYTYYSSKNWVREDDPVMQTATISKCRQNQFISLNLAKETYRLSDTSPKECGPTAPSTQNVPAKTTVVNEPPGTSDLTMSSRLQGLGPKVLDGIRTTGVNDAFEMSTTNATGSCKNGDMKMTSIVYTSGINQPRAYCPLVTPKYVPSSPNEVVERGGCKPRIHMRTGGVMPGTESNRLALYMLMTLGGGATASQPKHAFSTLLERGNIAWLSKSRADPLFEIPAGFTQEK
ncbi:MAG: hypothetical protein ABI282_00125 [Candidatus Baltobacteraceae bacterium]